MIEDLKVFLKDFSENVTVVKDGRVFPAIFDCPSVDTRLGGYQVEAQLPKLTCLNDDIANIDKGEKLLIRDMEYEVIANQPDRTGFSRLVLELYGS